MTIYIALLLMLFILRYGAGTDPQLNQIFYRFSLIVLFLFSAFRFEVGCDWSGYLNQYFVVQDIRLSDALADQEPLWWATLWVQAKMGFSYPWINFFSSAICFCGLHILARRQPDSLGFLVLLFPVLIVNMPMSGIRQATAIGCVSVAFTAFMDKRVMKFLIFTLIGAGFHSSAAVFLLLAPLVGGEYTRGRLLLSGLLALPGVYLVAKSAAADVAFSRYVGTGNDAFGAAYRTCILFLSGLFFRLFLQRSWSAAYPRSYKLASVGALMMLAVFPLVIFSSVIADRFGYYFIPIQAMIFARIPYLQRPNASAFLTVSPYLGLALVFIVWLATSSIFGQCYIPYRTWLFGFPAQMRYQF